MDRRVIGHFLIVTETSQGRGRHPVYLIFADELAGIGLPFRPSTFLVGDVFPAFGVDATMAEVIVLRELVGRLN